LLSAKKKIRPAKDPAPQSSSTRRMCSAKERRVGPIEDDLQGAAWMALRLLVHQAISFAAVTAVTIRVLQALDVSNPKSQSSVGSWTAESLWSLAVMQSMLLFLLLFSFVFVLLDRRDHHQQLLNHDQNMPSGKTGLQTFPSLLPEERRLDGIAWPTALLALASNGLLAISAQLGATGRVPPAVAVVLCTIAIFCSFTPMHDAVHRSVAPRNAWVNELVGYLASAPYMFVFRSFRAIHLAHHRHCNEGRQRDPDHWAGEGPTLLLPLRWASVFMWYNTFVILRAAEAEQHSRRHTKGPDKGSGDEVGAGTAGRNAQLWRSLHAELSILPALLPVLLWWRFEVDAVTYWLLPFFLATSYLMYVFDYIPHRPYAATHAQDPFKATSPFYAHAGLPEGHLTLPLLCQNYHNVHHLYPFLPFYRYPSVWHRLRGELKRRGTREQAAFQLLAFGGRSKDE
jgi:beta-carotene hydroxylase